MPSGQWSHHPEAGDGRLAAMGVAAGGTVSGRAIRFIERAKTIATDSVAALPCGSGTSAVGCSGRVRRGRS